MRSIRRSVAILLAGLLLVLVLPPASSVADLSGPRLSVVDYSSDHAGSGGMNDFRAVLAVDGNPDTFWSNDYQPKANPPHYLVLDLGATMPVAGFKYLPRQDGYNGEENGNLGPYEVLVSTDGKTFSEAHAGTFDPYSQKESSVLFPKPVPARYFQLRTDMEWVGVAELKILTGPPPGATATPAPTGGTVPERSVGTDRVVYEQGDDIVASFSGSTEMGTWIGICSEEAPRYPGHSIGVWLHVNSGTQTAGAQVVESGTVTFAAARFGAALAPGEYAMYLMAEDWTTPLAEAHFIIVEKGGDTTPPSEPEPPAGIAYERTATRKGDAAGRVTVSPPADDRSLRGFELFWGDEDGRLASYTRLAYLPYKPGTAATHDIPAGLAVPREATRILAFSRSWGALTSDVFASVDLDPADRLPESPRLYSFQVISDLHVTSDPSFLHSLHLEQALQDILATDPGSTAIFTVGDNTDHGLEAEWTRLRSLFDAVLSGGKPPVHFTLGNHDVGPASGPGDPVERYRRHTGAPGPYYSVEAEGTSFIVLASQTTGSGTGGANLEADQLSWLEDTLEKAARKEGPIFLFLHQPMKDTVSGSLQSVDPAVQVWHGVIQEAELRALLDRYPQATLFTGHTHWQFESLQPILMSDGRTANYVNCASVAYLWTDGNTEKEGSQGLQVEVYADHVLIRGRDYVEKAWVASAQFLLPIRSAVPTRAPTPSPTPAEEKPASGPPPWLPAASAAILAVAAAATAAAVLRKRKRTRS